MAHDTGKHPGRGQRKNAGCEDAACDFALSDPSNRPLARHVARRTKPIAGHPSFDRDRFARYPQTYKEWVANRSHCYVYIFGLMGGPFKVGRSNNPKKRAYQIGFYYPGNYFCRKSKDAIMWFTFRLPNTATAERIERAAHSKLRKYKLHAPDSSSSVAPTEWFDVTLPTAIEAVMQAARAVL
jgi:T5orf172 domain